MPSSMSVAALDADQRNRLEQLLMEFDRDWQPRSLESFAGRLKAELTQDAFRPGLHELIRIDLHRRWSSGQGKPLDAYIGNVSVLGTIDTVDVELILAEYRARKSVEPDLDLASFEKRFPRQFNDLRRRVEEAGASESLDDHAKSAVLRIRRNQPDRQRARHGLHIAETAGRRHA